MSALTSFHARLLHAIHGISAADLRRREGENRWSIAHVLAHLTDAELVTSVRFRAMLAETQPALIGYSQNEWVGVREGESVAELLEQQWLLRRFNDALLERQTPEALERMGIHAEYGTLTIRELAERHVAHLEQHLRQIVRIRATLQLATSSPLEGVVSARDGHTSSPGAGINVTELWRDGVHRALRVDIPGGAQWPETDFHIPGPEEVYVLSGDLDDGVQTFSAGTFIHHPAGSSHRPRSEEGCSLFVFYGEG